MNQDRRAVFQLLALGRINPAQAERLIAAAGAERETVWVLAGCAAMMLFAQLKPLAPGLAHLAHAVIAGGMPALHRIVDSIASIAGGMS
jgi:hypothetical protein